MLPFLILISISTSGPCVLCAICIYMYDIVFMSFVALRNVVRAIYEFSCTFSLSCKQL